MVEPGWPQIIRHMRFACRIPKARIRARARAHTHTPTHHTKNLLLFHSKNCYENAPQHYKYIACLTWRCGEESLIMWPYKDILYLDVAQNVAHRRSHTEGRRVRNQTLISSVCIITQLLRGCIARSVYCYTYRSNAICKRRGQTQTRPRHHALTVCSLCEILWSASRGNEVHKSPPPSVSTDWYGTPNVRCPCA
jgi:hypothetical protein